MRDSNIGNAVEEAMLRGMSAVDTNALKTPIKDS